MFKFSTTLALCVGLFPLSLASYLCVFAILCNLGDLPSLFYLYLTNIFPSNVFSSYSMTHMVHLHNVEMIFSFIFAHNITLHIFPYVVETHRVTLHLNNSQYVSSKVLWYRLLLKIVEHITFVTEENFLLIFFNFSIIAIYRVSSKFN